MNSNRQRLAARRRKKKQGSLTGSEPLFVVVGKLRRPHGLKGEALVSVLTDFPERLQPGVKLYLGPEQRPITLQKLRVHNQGLLLSFVELSSREDLESVRNQMLYVKVSDLPDLGEGEYYHHQLIGIQVWEEQGSFLGQVEEIMQTGANDVYIVRSADGKEMLLPATAEVIQSVDLLKKRILVRLIPGLET